MELSERIAREIIREVPTEDWETIRHNGSSERLTAIITRHLAAQSQWQPIESAPTGEIVNVYCLYPSGGGYAMDRVIRWKDGSWHFTSADDLTDDVPRPIGKESEKRITHWMPLPSPPDAAQPLHWPFTARHANCADCDREYEPPPAAQPVAGEDVRRRYETPISQFTKAPCCGGEPRAIYYNPYNRVIQCHQCGHVYEPKSPCINGIAATPTATLLAEDDDLAGLILKINAHPLMELLSVAMQLQSDSLCECPNRPPCDGECLAGRISNAQFRLRKALRAHLEICTCSIPATSDEPLDAEIAEVQRLYEQTTQGEWTFEFGIVSRVKSPEMKECDGSICSLYGDVSAKPKEEYREWKDGTWIAAAHNLWPKLVARAQAQDDAAFHRGVDAAKEAIRSEEYPCENYCAAAFINAIARKCGFDRAQGGISPLKGEKP